MQTHRRPSPLRYQEACRHRSIRSLGSTGVRPKHSTSRPRSFASCQATPSIPFNDGTCSPSARKPRYSSSQQTGRLLGVRCLGTALVLTLRSTYQIGAKAPHSKEAHTYRRRLRILSSKKIRPTTKITTEPGQIHHRPSEL